MQQSRDEICFTISGAICQHLSDWEFAFDEMVFNEQLATGSFRGRYPVEGDILSIMQQIKAKGGIAPYYGVGGGRGTCSYALQLTNTGYSVKVENAVVNEAAEFHDRPHIEETEPDVRFILKIDGKELDNLRRWENWVEAEASTARYVYQFGQVSMGRLGYAVEVEDTATGDIVDVTAYEDW